jgi:hypothetical protein
MRIWQHKQITPTETIEQKQRDALILLESLFNRPRAGKADLLALRTYRYRLRYQWDGPTEGYLETLKLLRSNLQSTQLVIKTRNPSGAVSLTPIQQHIENTRETVLFLSWAAASSVTFLHSGGGRVQWSSGTATGCRRGRWGCGARCCDWAAAAYS